VSVPSSTGGEVSEEWLVLPVYIQEEGKLGWWSGPIRRGGGVGVVGVKEVGVGECVSVYGSLETLSCCFFPFIITKIRRKLEI
jgi:hypothetical protein